MRASGDIKFSNKRCGMTARLCPRCARQITFPISLSLYGTRCFVRQCTAPIVHRCVCEKTAMRIFSLGQRLRTFSNVHTRFRSPYRIVCVRGLAEDENNGQSKTTNRCTAHLEIIHSRDALLVEGFSHRRLVVARTQFIILYMHRCFVLWTVMHLLKKKLYARSLPIYIAYRKPNSLDMLRVCCNNPTTTFLKTCFYIVL